MRCSVNPFDFIYFFWFKVLVKIYGVVVLAFVIIKLIFLGVLLIRLIDKLGSGIFIL